MNLSWYYYIDQKKIEFFHSSTIKKVVEDVIIPTLPNVGTALFEVCALRRSNDSNRLVLGRP
jgi:hypothetical protein